MLLGSLLIEHLGILTDSIWKQYYNTKCNTISMGCNLGHVGQYVYMWGPIKPLKFHPLEGHKIYILGASAVLRTEQTGHLPWAQPLRTTLYFRSAFHIQSPLLVSGTHWDQQYHLDQVP